MWARPDESRERIVADYRRAWRHSAATIETLPLDTVGVVPWWPSDANEATLHHIVIRVIADAQRHAGQADIVREFIDGSAGMLPGKTGLTSGDQAWWTEYRTRVQGAANTFRQG